MFRGDVAHFALVAGRGELAVVRGRRIDEPDPGHTIGVEPDGVAGAKRHYRFVRFPESSFRIVPMPRSFVSSELLLLPNRSRKKYSSASILSSPFTSMEMVFDVSPGLKVRVPVLAK